MCVGRAGEVEHDGKRACEVQSQRDPLCCRPDRNLIRGLRAEADKDGRGRADSTTATILSLAMVALLPGQQLLQSAMSQRMISGTALSVAGLYMCPPSSSC